MALQKAVFLDETGSKKTTASLNFGPKLEIRTENSSLIRWAYSDIRRFDQGDGVLRLGVDHAPQTARLEIADAEIQALIVVRCPALYGESSIGTLSNRHIVGWTFATLILVGALIIWAVPRLAAKLVDFIPASLERQLGDLADLQSRQLYGGKTCTNLDGIAAFDKLVAAVADKAALTNPPRPDILDSAVPNAFALPGGKIYVLRGLLDKAESPDELAGVLAHELGHVAHRDGLRKMVEDGGVATLISLLTGGDSMIGHLSQNLVFSHYSRDSETSADDFALSIMGQLGRSPRPMGDLLQRLGPAEKADPTVIFASHPLTSQRIAALSKPRGPVDGPEILLPQEWQALKSICR